MPKRTITLENFLRDDVTVLRKSLAAKIVTHLGIGLTHKDEAVEDEIITGCKMLCYTNVTKTMQYAYVQKLLVFLEIAEFSVHSKRKTSLYDDLINGERIYINMYDIIRCDI